jgi:hypothetical protein
MFFLYTYFFILTYVSLLGLSMTTRGHPGLKTTTTQDNAGQRVGDDQCRPTQAYDNQRRPTQRNDNSPTVVGGAFFTTAGHVTT